MWVRGGLGLGGIRRSIDQPFFVLLLFFSEKITQGVNVIAEALCQFLPHRADFGDHWIIDGAFHFASHGNVIDSVATL